MRTMAPALSALYSSTGTCAPSTARTTSASLVKPLRWRASGGAGGAAATALRAPGPSAAPSARQRAETAMKGRRCWSDLLRLLAAEGGGGMCQPSLTATLRRGRTVRPQEAQRPHPRDLPVPGDLEGDRVVGRAVRAEPLQLGITPHVHAAIGPLVDLPRRHRRHDPSLEHERRRQLRADHQEGIAADAVDLGRHLLAIHLEVEGRVPSEAAQ